MNGGPVLIRRNPRDVEASGAGAPERIIKRGTRSVVPLPCLNCGSRNRKPNRLKCGTLECQNCGDGG